MGEYISSTSGVKVWTKPEFHPLLKHTDTKHQSFQDKLAEIYSRGKVKGLPRICSINSEDARTWHYFSPLLVDQQKKMQVLACLLNQAFPEILPTQTLEAAQYAGLEFWKKIEPPPSRYKFRKEGLSEPDVLITLGQHTVVFVEAKYRSGVSTKTEHDKNRDQVIRIIDVGSWYAKTGGYDSCYVIVLQYGDKLTNAEKAVSLYHGKPEAIQRALHYRTDLNESDYQRLSNSVAFVRWPDPMGNE